MMKIINQLTAISLTTLVLLVLSGCSAYKNKFACDPATGAHCQSVEDIHAMLQNGKIWELNSNKTRGENKKGRQSTKSKHSQFLQEEDRIASFDGILKVWIPEQHRMQEYREGQYWYISAQEL
jgi:hypothetical protein